MLGETGRGQGRPGSGTFHREQSPGEAFVEVNRAAIPEGLVEAKLFGFEPGLLTALDQGQGRRLDGTRPETVDTRVPSATSEDLSAAVVQGRFPRRPVPAHLAGDRAPATAATGLLEIAERAESREMLTAAHGAIVALRAATASVELSARTAGRVPAADRHRLAGIYAEFTEGLELADLRAAREGLGAR